MKFIPGMQLCEGFFHDIIKPMLAKEYPQLQYSAAKINQGSDVIGYDTEMSMDHGWGFRLMIFMNEADHERYHDELLNYFAYNLPFEYKGISTHFADIENRDSGYIVKNNEYPIKHRIIIYTISSFFNEYLGFNPVNEISEAGWLTAPNQHMLTVSKGKIFHDGLGGLEKIKEKLKWYPDDIWLYLLACQWRKIEQEEPFMARCGIVNDEVGSRLVASRMINEIMKLCFLMEKQYYPYYKWFGTAFSELNCGKKFNELFINVLNAVNWKEREKYLSKAYEELAKMHK